MALVLLAGLMAALGSLQDVPPPQDNWVAGASPLRMITDPCDPDEEGEEGMSLPWIHTVLLQRGHPRDLVCGLRSDFDPETVASAQADFRDLGAQVTGRAMVVIGSTSRPLDDDGAWGEKSEAGSRALYLHLKADDYRALRELQAQDALPAPTPP